MQAYTRKELAKTIDHSVLSAQAGAAALRAGCELARRYDVKSVCVKPCHVRLAAEILAGSGVRVAATLSFPHGADVPAVKADQARAAIADGVDELDMVINIAMLRDGDVDGLRNEIADVVRVAEGRCVKVILECALLNDEQKLAGCRAAELAGAQFVKTSTGFAPSGATVEDIRLIRSALPETMHVKAAGGIRTAPDALAMIRAGADRLGTSATAAILDALDT